MFQNTTEIIRNFLSYFLLFYYSDCSCLSFLCDYELSSSDPVSVCSPDKCNLPLWGHSFGFGSILTLSSDHHDFLIKEFSTFILWFYWGKEWSLSTNSICSPPPKWLAVIKTAQKEHLLLYTMDEEIFTFLLLYPAAMFSKNKNVLIMETQMSSMITFCQYGR